MYWQRRVVMALAAWVAAAGPGRAQTAEDAVKAVPEQALGFVVINNLGAVSDKVAALAKKVGAPLPFAPLDKFKSETGIDKGLNASGSALVAVLGGDGGAPAPVVYIPVSDYQAFLSGLGAKAGGDVVEVNLANGMAAVVGKKGPFALVTQPQFRDALEQALKATAAGAAFAPVQAWVSDNDIAGVLPAKTVQLLAFMGQQGLGLVKQFAGNLPKEAQTALVMLDSIEDLLKATGTDVNHLALGARVDQGGNLGLGLLALFVKDSGFAKIGAGSQRPEGGPLTGLPGAPYAFAFGGAISEGAMKGLANFGTQVLGAATKQDPEKMKKLEDVTADMVKGLRSMSMLMGMGKGQATLFDGTYAVMKVEDSQAYLRNYAKYIKTYQDTFKDTDLAGAMDMKVKEIMVEGLSALEIEMQMKGLDNLPEQQKQLMAIYFDADGKMKVTSVAVDKNTVLLRYTPPAGIKEFLKDYRAQSDRLARDQQVAKTTALLPEGAQWVGLMNLTGTLDLVNRVLAQMPQIGGLQLPLFPEAPPLGFGCKMSAAGMESRLVFPAAALQGIGAYVQQLKQFRGGLQ